MGLSEQLSPFHRFGGLRATAHGKTLELTWPEHPVYPSYGYVVRRRELDQLVVDNAVKAGVTLWEGTEALQPMIERGFVRGAVVQRKDGLGAEEVRARYVVVADGANSRFGRALGTSRHKEWPYGTAIRGYWGSPLTAEPWIESCLDVKDRNGNPMPGYGWIFPVGDGTVNIGVGLLSTFRDFKGVNTTNLLREYVATAPDYWQLEPDAARGPPDQRPAADGRLGRPQGRADPPRGRRCRRHRQPVQRRGHRLRLRDRAHGRRGAPRGHHARTTRSCCSSTRSASRPSTASTSRSPACSPT